MNNPKTTTTPTTTASRRQRLHAVRVLRDRIFVIGFVLAVVIGIAGLAALLLDVLVDGLPFLNWNFLTSYASRKPLDSGILAPLAARCG